MKKLSWKSSWLGILCLFGISEVQARPFQGALPVAQGRWGLGAFGDLSLTDPLELMAIGQGIYGISPEFQGEMRFGFGTIDFTFGTFGKYLLFSNEHASAAIHSGFSYLRNVTWEGSFLVSRDLDGIEFRIAPHFHQLLVNRAPLAVDLILGADIPLESGLHLQAELALKIKDSSNRLALGLSRQF